MVKKYTDHNSLEALFERANSYLKQKHYQQAEIIFHQILSQSSDNPFCL